MVAACLLLAGRAPEADDLAGLGDDSPKRLRMAAILRGAPGRGEAAAEPLRRWLDRPSLPDLPLPLLDRAADWAVGHPSFKEGTGLVGFHEVEPDHVWARGTAAFLGVRLGAAVARVELLVRHVDARTEEPCTLTLAVGDAEARVVATTPEPVWIGLDLPSDVTRPLAVTWCHVTAARARRPPGSADTRVLGIALIRLRVTLRAGLAMGLTDSDAVGPVAA